MKRFVAISLPWLALIVFVILRLCNVIKWSWWWVFAPVSIPFAIAVMLILGAALGNALSKKKV